MLFRCVISHYVVCRERYHEMEGSKSVIIDDDELKCIRLAHAQASVKFLQGHLQSENLILMKSQISRLKHKCSHYTLFCF